jgi:hypothetical protein
MHQHWFVPIDGSPLAVIRDEHRSLARDPRFDLQTESGFASVFRRLIDLAADGGTHTNA